MADTTALESVPAELPASVSPRLEPAREPVHEEDTLPERSPTLMASALAARLEEPRPARAPPVGAAVSRIQSRYGNAYATELVARLREGGPAAGASEPAAGAAAPAAPAPTRAPPTPSGPESASSVESAALAAPAEPAVVPATVPTAEPAREPGSEAEPAAPPGPPPPSPAAPQTEAAMADEAVPSEPAEAAAAPAPEPPAPEPAAATPAEATGEEPAGGEVEMADAAAGEGEAAAGEPPGPEAAPEGGEGEPGAEAEPGAAPAEGEGEVERAPSSPEEDPAYQAVIDRARTVARRQAHNNPAQQKAAEAQAAAPAPPTEVEDAAAGEQVGKMAEQEPPPFDKESFKAALMEKVEEIAPSTLEDADEFKESGKTATIKGAVSSEVTESKEATTGPVEETTEETPDTSGVEPKQVEPLPATEPGPPPPDLGAEAAAPKPKTAAEVSLEQNSAEIDDLAESSDPPLTEELVQKSNEPEFQAAHDAKESAQQDAAERPAAYREQEAAILEGARAEAADNAARQTGAMHETRAEQFSSIVAEQAETQTEDQSRRDEVLQNVRTIYEETKTEVTDRLDRLDEEVNTAFDEGAERARTRFDNYVDQRMRAYKRRRYGGFGGGALWIKDKLLGLPDEVNAFYTEGRDLYIRLMDGVIDHVAGIVATGLNEAMGIIEAGKQRVETYVAGLPAELQEVGQQAAANIQSEFDGLAQEVRNRESQLIDSLAQRYSDNLASVDAAIEEMQAANRGLVDAALEAVGGVIATILELKNMLLGVLSRAGDVIGTIISDPIGFLGNLVGAVRLGLENFIANIGTHLQQGLMGWLFGALAEAGIQMPESFDLRGILSLVLQVLGLTYANIRARAVAIVGEDVVSALEQAAEVFRVLITEGPAGLWDYIKERLANLRDVVIEGIKSFVMERIIMAGITWLIGLLNPAAAFIKACKAIYDIIMFFVTRGSQIMAMVNAILDSLAAIASGAIGGAAAAVENALARAVPVVISFLASLLGLGGISQKIREIIQRIQAPVNAAIDWVINKAVRLVRAVGGLFGGRREEEPGEEVEEDDPEKAARIEAGLAAIDEAEQRYLEEGRITEEEALEVADGVKRAHPVFTSLVVVDGGDKWNYRYAASPTKEKKGPKKAGAGQYNVAPHVAPPPEPGQEGESHHVPPKVLKRWFGEIYEIMGEEAEDENTKRRGTQYVGDTVGSGLSAIWLSEEAHRAAHASPTGHGEIESLENEIVVTTRRGRESSRPQRGTIARSVLESEAEGESTSGGRAQVNRRVYAAIKSRVAAVFNSVFRGMLRSGIGGVKRAGLEDDAWEGDLTREAESTWSGVKNPD